MSKCYEIEQRVRCAKAKAVCKLFNGDLAEVVMLDSSKDMVHLFPKKKLFPGIDYTKFRGFPKSEQNASGARKLFIKPHQKVFDSRALVDIIGKVKVDVKFTVFEENRYKDGFIYKIFPIDVVVHEGVQLRVSCKNLREI